MKAAERDELLIRIDERLNYVCGLTEKQEKHLAELNNRTQKSELNIDRNHNRLTIVEDDIRTLVSSGMPLKLTRKQMVGGSSGIAGILTMLLAALGKVLGWW